MDKKNNTNLQNLEEEEEEKESDHDDAVSLSGYITDDQELESSGACLCSNNDYSFEFPFNGNQNDAALVTAVNFFGGSFDDRRRYLCGDSEKTAPNLILPVKSKSCRSPTMTDTYRHRQWSNLRKHKVLFGLAKIPTKMELSDIKKRQSRRNPVPPNCPAVPGETTVVDRGGGKRHRSVLVVPFKQCGVHLASVLAKASFGCVSRV